MDKEQRASYIITTSDEIIQTFYRVRDGQADVSKLIKQINIFFDKIKTWELTEGLLSFLYEMSIFIGLPHYFEMYLNFSKSKFDVPIDTSILTASLYDSSLVIGKHDNDSYQKLHKYQKEVIDKFESGKLNRYFLTAPTSFGKTYIVNEIIKKLKYNKIVLIFPTLSLLAENFARLLQDPFFNEYRIHTLSNFEEQENTKDIWIYTPERFMTMTDKYSKINFDFIFMDEIYKIDNKFIIDSETIGESERDISYRIALGITCKKSKDFLLAGPYINIPNNDAKASIINFLNDNSIMNLNYNQVEIVDKEVVSIHEKKAYTIDEIEIAITNSDKNKRLVKVIEAIGAQNGNTIIYVAGRYDAERLAKTFAKSRTELTQDAIRNLGEISENEKEKFIAFIMHLNSKFDKGWTLIHCLKHRIGIHHGYIPKYIQKEVIHFFNMGILDCIFSTTTITEGVNTSAKNMIVMSDKKGDKPLKKFDAQNIAGRAGRFVYHYKGRVIAVDNTFEEILNDDDSFINHIGYDDKQNKNEIDIMVTDEKYLTDLDKKTRKELLEDAEKIGMPNEIVEQFRSVPLRDKILLYRNMINFGGVEEFALSELRRELVFNRLNWTGFEIVLRYIYPIIKNDNLKRMIELKTGNYSVLTPKVNSYITDGGFGGILKFELSRKTAVDTAVRTAAELAFNIFRYHLVKYLGIFDLIYRHIKAKSDNSNPDEIAGLGLLLQLLEYGTKSDKGKVLSDYGVPYNVLRYVDSDNPQRKDDIKNNLDKYESDILSKIKELFSIE